MSLNDRAAKDFLEDSKWQNLTLNTAFTGSVKYRKKNKEVEIHSTASRSSGTGLGNIGTLPAGFRPKDTIYSTGYGGSFTIYDNGVVQVSGGVTIAYFIVRFFID